MIPLMNIERQYEIIKKELDEATIRVLSSGKYIMGENVKEFEKEFSEYMEVKYAIGVGNGTDALVIALRACGIKAGDEVITCAMSFFATAEAISSVGAIPVFVDCTSDTYTIDASKIEEKITEKTKAIIPVHLYGQCADMDEINEIAKKYNLLVIEDVAQAAGATYKGKKAGSLGDIACVSFFPTKNLGCAGDGGMILTDSEDLVKKCHAYRVHGSGLDGKYTYESINKITDAESIDFGENLPKYYNFLIGYNSRLDEIQAAILRVKLKKLDKWNKTRETIAKRYSDLINNNLIIKPICKEGRSHIYYTYVIKTENREKLREELTKAEISSGVYFPVPLHLQKVYEHLGYKKGDMPNAESIANDSLAIPIFPELINEEQDKVIEVLNKYVG
ncbi:DegT/DnrJ/EryC1/StrS family aminotransferase (plasmid) [Fusobacterium sp. SB021]|uniref:DegT/DnrJ/EryC1/StrS family aminotransferase n=1 Tax=Fusobacterium sp. SB021 TaxID=2744227 RepID=UPI003CF4F1D8